MSRRILCLVALTALAAGCGESLPSTPIERGAALVHYGRYGEAIDAYTEAIQLKPQDPQAYLLRGRAYHARNEAGDLDAAVADFSTGIGLAPKDSELLYNRSMAYRDLGDEEMSHEDAEAARALDGQVTETYSALPESGSTPKIDADAIAAEARAAVMKEAAATPAEPNKPSESASDLRRRLEAQAAESGKEGFGGGAFPSERSRPLGSASDFDSRRRADEYDRRRLSDSPLERRNPAAERRRRESERNSAAASSSSDAGRQAAEAPRMSEAPYGRDPRTLPTTSPGAPPPSTSPYGAPSGMRSGSPTAGLGPQYPAPYQPPSSPFPQRPPRPTGFVEEQPTGPVRAQPRPYFNAPYQPPANQPPGTR